MDRIFIFVALLIFFGAINTIRKSLNNIELKLQNVQVVNQETGEKFFHPFMQTVLFFFG